MAKKVLVVDDDIDILDAVTLLLEADGFDTQKISRGEEIYNAIASYKPDMILLDMLMSGTDGRVLCANLKKNNKTKKIPIVMMSAHPDARRSIKMSGANDFLSKPFEGSDLLEVVQKYTN
jgi:DNA-binding response OmpR family regulator